MLEYTDGPVGFRPNDLLWQGRVSLDDRARARPPARGRRRRRIAATTAAGIGIVACGEGGRKVPAPTFARDVAPIVAARCSACHRPERPVPFPLLTWSDIRAAGPAIARAVEEGRMPPWPPSSAGVPLAGERRLTSAERRTILDWVAAGMPPGDLASLPPPPEPVVGWRLGEPDRVVRSPRPYRLPAEGGDRFRNLVIPLSLPHRVWVRGVELRFEDPAAVHHAMVTFDATTSSRREEARDPEPGFDGMFGTTGASGPPGFLLGWTPGREPALSPEGLAFAVDPRTDLVLQVHLRPDGRPHDIVAEVGLYLAEGPPSREPFTIRLGADELDIPAGDSSYIETDTYTLPVEVEILGIYPHAHYLGRRLALGATLPDSTRVKVFEIPDWDFGWQDAYRLEEPLRLPRGTRLEGWFEYDNSVRNPRNPSVPPRRVTYGPGSKDEMGELWIQVLPGRPSDLPALEADFGRKYLSSKVTAWRHTLRIHPGEPGAHVGLGTLAQNAGRHREAIEHFERALEARPDYVVAHYNLGVSRESIGDAEGAAAEYRQVIALDPGHAQAHNNLGVLAARAGDPRGAVAHFEAAVRADPADPRALNNLGNALRGLGDLDRAAASIQRSLEIAPGFAAARLNLALIAWARATSPDPGARDGATAVRLAERALVGSRVADPRLLDALAAAYAEAGRFEDAVAAASRAVRATPGGPAGSAAREDRRRRLETYREGRPYRSAPDRGGAGTPSP